MQRGRGSFIETLLIPVKEVIVSDRKWREVAFKVAGKRQEVAGQNLERSVGVPHSVSRGRRKARGTEKRHQRGASHLVVAPHRVAEGFICQHLSLSVQEGQEALLDHHQLLLVDLREQKNQGRNQGRRQDRREAEDNKQKYPKRT